jgi:hypothetical protein
MIQFLNRLKAFLFGVRILIVDRPEINGAEIKILGAKGKKVVVRSIDPSSGEYVKISVNDGYIVNMAVNALVALCDKLIESHSKSSCVDNKCQVCRACESLKVSIMSSVEKHNSDYPQTHEA